MPLLAALDGQALTISQLVQAVGVSQPGVTRGIGQLVDLGLFSRSMAATSDGEPIAHPAPGWLQWRAAKLPSGHRWSKRSTPCAVVAPAFPGPYHRCEAALAATPIDLPGGAGRTPRSSQSVNIRMILPSTSTISTPSGSTPCSAWKAYGQEVLENPRAKIIDAGGAILFVEARGLGIVRNMCPSENRPNSFELTKMGVRESARGLKAGEFLLAAMIERARSLGADPLYLLTNAAMRGSRPPVRENRFRSRCRDHGPIRCAL